MIPLREIKMNSLEVVKPTPRAKLKALLGGRMNHSQHQADCAQQEPRDGGCRSAGE